MTDNQKVKLLKEYISIAKRNGLAKNYAEFAELIGKGSPSTINNVLNGGRGSVDAYLAAAKDALAKAGVPLDDEKTKVSTLEKVVERLDRIEKLLLEVLENQKK